MILRVRTYRLDTRDPRVGGAGLSMPKLPLAPGRDPAEAPAETGADRRGSEG